MTDYLVVFVAVYLLNCIPAFAPPTWMMLSLVGFNHPQFNPLVLAMAAAVAATLGRITLARLSQTLIRNKLLSDKTKANIDVLRLTLETRKHQTMGGLLLFSFTPLPSNYLFIAYGLTALPIKLIALPFFIGRYVSYAAWIFVGQEAYKSLDINAGLIGGYLGGYFILSQIGFMLLVYLFTRIDWRALLLEKKLKLLK
jgi:membrane protein YqaA with SNARE-associated domain